MPKKGEIARFLVSVGLLLFCAGLAAAQMSPIYRFKGINVPVKLKIKDKTFDKGTYDLEFLRTSSPLLYYIKLIKGGKTLDIIQGEEWAYAHGIASDVLYSQGIPTKPTLKMAKNTAEKLLLITFESGRNAANYPLIRARFKLTYEE